MKRQICKKIILRDQDRSFRFHVQSPMIRTYAADPLKGNRRSDLLVQGREYSKSELGLSSERWISELFFYEPALEMLDEIYSLGLHARYLESKTNV
jgi:hypothetical protein